MPPDRKAEESLSRNRGTGCDYGHGRKQPERSLLAAARATSVAGGLRTSAARAVACGGRICEVCHGKFGGVEGAGAGDLRTLLCPPWERVAPRTRRRRPFRAIAQRAERGRVWTIRPRMIVTCG